MNSAAPTYEVTKTERPFRRIGTCKRCKKTHLQIGTVTTTRTLRSDQIYAHVSRVYAGLVAIECCDRSVDLRDIVARKTETPCGPRCTHAKGHVCDCSCGGRNHGSGH